MLPDFVLNEGDTTTMYHSGTEKYYQVKVLRHIEIEELIAEAEFLESQGA